MSNFGTQLELAIQKIGLTQAALADRAGMTPAAISQLISGNREPMLTTLLQICTALRLTPNDLLGFHYEKHIKVRHEISSLKLKISKAMEILDD